jgi:hypothetical protein
MKEEGIVPQVSGQVEYLIPNLQDVTPVLGIDFQPGFLYTDIRTYP